MFQPEYEQMDRNRLCELQLNRLKSTLDRIEDTNGFYLQKINNLTSRDINVIEDISKFPLMTKDDLRIGYPFKYTCAPSTDFMRIHMSSGTTGTPIINPYTRNDLNQWANIILSLVVGIFGLFSDLATGVVIFMAPWFVTLFVMFFFITILFRILGTVEDSSTFTSLKGMLFVVLLVTLLVAIFVNVGEADGFFERGPVSGSAKVFFHPKVLGSLFILLVAIFTKLTSAQLENVLFNDSFKETRMKHCETEIERHNNCNFQRSNTTIKQIFCLLLEAICIAVSKNNPNVVNRLTSVLMSSIGKVRLAKLFEQLKGGYQYINTTITYNFDRDSRGLKAGLNRNNPKTVKSETKYQSSFRSPIE